MFQSVIFERECVRRVEHVLLVLVDEIFDAQKPVLFPFFGRAVFVPFKFVGQKFRVGCMCDTGQRTWDSTPS